MRKQLLVNLTFLCSLVLVVGATFLSYGAIVHGSVNEHFVFVPDEITIEFKEQVGDISIVPEDGIAATGIPLIDSLNRKYQVIAMYKLFPGELPPATGSGFKDLSRSPLTFVRTDNREDLCPAGRVRDHRE